MPEQLSPVPTPRELEPYFRWGSTVAAVVFGSWLVANLSGLGVPLWVLLSVLVLLTGVPAMRFWARQLRERELAVERAKLAARKDGPAVEQPAEEPKKLNY